MPNSRDIIAQVAGSKGIPIWIPTAIAMKESSLNAMDVTMDTNGYDSVGLFQLNLNGLGKGHSIAQLRNAEVNSDIAISAMVPAFKQAQAQGLQGEQLLDYVANNSGWPDSKGVAFTNQVEPDYDKGLNNIYHQLSGDYQDPTTATSPKSNWFEDTVTGASTGDWGPFLKNTPWIRILVIVVGIILAMLLLYRIATK